MTPSQEKVLEETQLYPSYKNHYMKDRNLIIECEVEYTVKRLRDPYEDEVDLLIETLPYKLVIGPRGGKKQLQEVGGVWREM